MDEFKDTFAFSDQEDVFSLKDTFLKYYRYWPFFLTMTLLSLFIGYLYMRYSSVNYLSTAKIKIVDDDKELDIAKDPSTLFWSGSSLNLDNEIEIIKSYRLINQVVTSLNLDISYFYKGIFKTSEVWDQPFVISDNVTPKDAVNQLEFDVELLADSFKITDDFDREFLVKYTTEASSVTGLPFNIRLLEDTVVEDFDDDDVFRVVLSPRKNVVLNLLGNLKVQPANKKSEILALSLIGESSRRSEDILNETIKKFNEDGILDRQLISKRTLDFLDERFLYLSGELDSIEAGKQGFKQENSLSYIEEDATSILQRKSDTEEEVFDLETQISLSRSLITAVSSQESYGLLPAEVGLENSAINAMVSEYNKLVLNRNKLLTSVGAKHPTLQDLNSELQNGKQNILKTLNVNSRQLNLSLSKLNQQKDLADEMFSRLPQKEKMLRSIDRQQSIKEKLFLLLLQKREEAAVNFAVTAPSIKVVDYGLTLEKPVSPNKLIVYSICLFLGVSIPFLVLYLRFFLDNKVYKRNDLAIACPEIPLVGEIPFVVNDKIFLEAGDRSVLAESFRILSTNITYKLRNVSGDRGKVIFITSSVKGEGKTFIALNLSLAFASLKKKVLLVGADLRNPRLQRYFDTDDELGLSHYLLYPEINFQEVINNGYSDNKFLKVCLTGKLPHNPSELLAGGVFSDFMERAKSEFDYIIVDTAPTMLVTDTMLISPSADMTLFVVRANFSDKRLLEFSKDLFKEKKLNNMAYLLNAIGQGDKSYNYGYEYGYGSAESFEELNKQHIVYSTLKEIYERLISNCKLAWQKAIRFVVKKQ